MKTAVLVLCLAAAAALRLHHLGTESVWLDEAFSIAAARGSLEHIVHETSQDVHPPLYYFALHYWMKLAGSTESAARLLSVLFSLGIIASAYAFAARVMDHRTALVAAVLLAVSPFQVEFAQEARMYALLALLGTLSTYSFLEAFVLRPLRPWWIAAYVVATVLMLYTQVYSVFVLAAQAGAVLLGFITARVWFRRIFWTWFATEVAIVILYVPWLSTLARQVSRVQHGFWIPERPWFAIFEPLWTYAGSVSLVCVLLPLVVWGAARFGPRWEAGEPPAPRPRTVLLLWLAAPIALPFILSRLGSPIFLPKYTIAASVPFAILAAYGLARLPGTWLRVLIVAAVVWLSVTPLQRYFNTPRKDGWRAAVARIETEAAPGDLLLVYRNFNMLPVDFYVRRADFTKAPFLLDDPPTPDSVRTALDHAVGEARRVWFLTLIDEPATPLVAEALRRSFEERAHTTAQRIETFLFAR